MPSPYRWVVLAVATVAFMQTHLHRMAFAPLIPTFVDDLGLTYAAAGSIQTAYFWTYTAVQIPVGLIADRWGVRSVMVACMALLAAGALVFALSGGYGEAVLARMVVGLGAAAVWVPGMRLLSEWFPPSERGRATGLMSAGGGFGGTLALVLVPIVATGWGWRVAYGMLAVPAAVTLALIVFGVRSGPPAAAAPVPRARGALRRVLVSRRLLPLNVAVLFSYGGYFSFLTFLPSFLVRQLDMTNAQAGVVTGLITAGTIVSWPLAGLLSDRLGRRKPVYLASQALSALACAVFALGVPSFTPWTVAATAVATGLLVGGMIVPFVMVVELFPAELAATAAGVTNAACFVGGMVLPIVLGLLVDVTGGFTAAFLVAAAVQALALGVGALVVETGPGRYTPERA
jgi:MFS family permease